MSASAALRAAVDVFTQLGWSGVSPGEAVALPRGTDEQHRLARQGLKSGRWGRFGQIGVNTYGWISDVEVPEDMLALFAVRVGIDAKRAAGFRLPEDRDAVFLVFAERSPAFAAAYATAPRSDAWLAARLVAHHGIEIPDSVSYLEGWSWYARTALLEGTDADLAVVGDRFVDHVRAAASTPIPPRSTGLDEVFALGLERGLLSRAEALEIAFSALDAAHRPGDRVVWQGLLDGQVGVTDGELRERIDALVATFSHGDSAIVEAWAPRLVGDVPDDQLVDVVSLSLVVKAKKARRAVLAALAARPRPGAAALEALCAAVAPLLDDKDAPLARAAARLVQAWDWDVAPEPTPTQGPLGLWQPVPPVWQVPLFEVPHADLESLAEATARLTGRPSGVVDVHSERFLVLANSLARTDREAARAALAGVGESAVVGLRGVQFWLTPPDESPRSTTGLIATRDALVFGELGALPTLLSTPTWEDLRIDPAQLPERLDALADAGVDALEPDLFLAATRSDPALVTPQTLAALRARTTVHVVLGQERRQAGPLLATMLAEPVAEPALVRSADYGWWDVPGFDLPAWAEPFTVEVGQRWARADLETFPHWGDAVGRGVSGDVFDNSVGLRARQLVRRGSPLSPGQVAGLLAAQAKPHERAADDVATAVDEAWTRGLLRGEVDTRDLSGGLGARAAVLGELAYAGMLAVVWPMLDALAAASAAAPRMLPGTADVLELMDALEPEVSAAAAAGLAPASALEVPGARAIAGRSGTSRAVAAARSLVGRLPAPGPAAPEAEADPRVPEDFEQVWAPVAETVIDDGAQLRAGWVAGRGAGRMMALDITPVGSPTHHRAVVQWMYALEREGQCDGVTWRDGEEPADGERAYLRWDVESQALVSAPERNWRGGTNGPLEGPGTPLTSSMVAAILTALCHERGDARYLVAHLVTRRVIGPGNVRLAIRGLLVSPDVSPAKMVLQMEQNASALAVLWPVLTESVAHAATLDKVPSWLNRVLDVALLHVDHLREAGRRGLLGEAAEWPGLAEIAARKGSSAALRKARELLELLAQSA